MTACDTATSTRPGFPQLCIEPVRAVAEPLSFATARGDDADPALDDLCRGVADVRLEVFVGEQEVPFIEEIDARDFEATTWHVLASGADGVPLGAARLLLEPEHPGQVHLGRLAVRRATRGTGLGARLVAAVEAAALEHTAAPLDAETAVAAGVPKGTGAVTVVLSAQEQAMGFYERCGYRTVSGERYLDAGIWHQDMARTLTW
ncbi:GNAT family N-acetyltransferase [Actinomyces haliotis]|uniref:GNAT family N-acetyltransferase n=1 Tax=Actinomyces haliotis TaxID=1280843 RepID=UPI00188F908B|nr:GNAT family N-acetyltransferase [Actinomyces haliotis]